MKQCRPLTGNNVYVNDEFVQEWPVLLLDLIKKYFGHGGKNPDGYCTVWNFYNEVEPPGAKGVDILPHDLRFEGLQVLTQETKKTV